MGTYYYESRFSDYLPYLEHYGVKGMKWEIRKQKDANKFYANLVKEGFDAISDTSDRKQGAQDPLIIVNMNKLNHTGSMELSKKDLDYYMNCSVYKKLEKKGKVLSSIQR